MINLEVKLPDTPGSLIELIKPISKNHGNIYGILHHHDKKMNNMIPVSISFDIPNDLIKTSLDKIQKELKEKSFEIVKITLGLKEHSLLVLITGHVFETDILDTIKRLAKKGIKTSELQAKFTEISDVSNVKLRFEYPEAMSEKELMNELKNICKEKNLFLIRA